MATSTVPWLAPTTARDGVDTRPQGEKDNWESAAAVNRETTRLGGGDQKVGGQTAALTFLLPPGADVAGTRMSAFWSNYLSTADRYIRGDGESFMFVSYGDQQACNERDIENECAKLGAGEETMNVFRQFYNAELVRYMKKPDTATYTYALELLTQYDDEWAIQTAAALKIQRAYKASKPRISETGTLIAEDTCSKCDEPTMGEWTNLCVDCYWDEDAAIKRARRAQRQNITVGFVFTPQPEVDVNALIERAVSPEQIPGWDAFWSTNGLRIKKPVPKNPCKCGAESTTKVKGKRMCDPCADFAQNVGRCYDCTIVGPRPRHEVRCYDCWDAFVSFVEQEDHMRFDW
jgi:hypothetical protein